MEYHAQREHVVSWLHEYLCCSKKSGFVLGLSGGIDSLTLALMGNEAASRSGGTLLAIITKMDYTYDYVDNSYAQKAVKMFGLSNVFIDLSEAFDALRRSLPSPFHPAAFTNLKARLRSSVLYYYANNQNLLVLGTVNRGEFMIGYFPKNASAGDILAMAHLSKRDIRGIAETYGVPEDMRERKASGCIFAETAEEEWGFTEAELDQMCDHVIARQPPDGIAEAKWKRFIEMHAASGHKRAFYPLIGEARSNK